jgi:hypothetical protein
MSAKISKPEARSMKLSSRKKLLALSISMLRQNPKSTNGK